MSKHLIIKNLHFFPTRERKFTFVSFQCVVIGLQSTGEARTLEQLEDSGGVLDDFVSTVKYALFFLARLTLVVPLCANVTVTHSIIYNFISLSPGVSSKL